MLSSDPTTTDHRLSSAAWLPELDSPAGITLDISSLSPGAAAAAPPPQKPPPDNSTFGEAASAETAPAESAPTSAPISSPISAPAESAPSGTPTSVPPAEPSPQMQACESDSDDVPVVKASANLLDQLELMFTFSTDPEIDAIATSPLLFSITLPSPSPVQPQAEEEEVAVEQKKEQTEDASGGRRLKSRRASIASMLMRRSAVFKNVDVVSIASKSSDSPRIQVREGVSSTDALEAQGNEAREEGRPVAESPAMVVPTIEELPGPEEASVAEEKAEPHEAGSVSEDGDGDAAAGDGASDKQSAASSSDEVPLPVKSRDEEAPASEAPASAHGADEPTCASECIGTEPLAGDDDGESAAMADGRRTMLSRRRSSRILVEGITRKVQHVRQTTSMVLKRSVGSRLSVVPMRSQDNFAVDCGLADRQGGRHESVDGPETHGAVEGEMPLAGETVDGAEPDEVEEEEEAAKASLIDSKPRRSGRAILSRGFVTVRRGTNIAVRSSVARVKNIFTPKRPPVAA